MILNKLDLDRLSHCATLDEVFKEMNVGEGSDYPFTDEKVWGKKANHANYFMTDSTYEMIYESLKKNEDDTYLYHGKTEQFPQATAWCNFSPISSGKRYEEFEKKVGPLNDSVLYIITPEDDMFQEAPEF